MSSQYYKSAFAGQSVYLGGMTAGFSLNTRGVQVVGFCDVLTKNGAVNSPAKNANLIVGDVILSINNKEINDATDIENNVKSDFCHTILIKRQNEEAIIAGTASGGSEITAELVCNGSVITTGKSYTNRKGTFEVSFKAPNGGYTEYSIILKENGVEQSFSRAGMPYDNSVCESFFGIYKTSPPQSQTSLLKASMPIWSAIAL